MPGLDITPQVPAGRQLIQGYGGLKFRIAGKVHEGSVVVFPERAVAWPVTEPAAVTIEALAPVTAADTPQDRPHDRPHDRPRADILVVGCGPRFTPPPKGLRAELKAAGLVLEWMDTGAACRTFNVLLVEERACAAALIAVE